MHSLSRRQFMAGGLAAGSLLSVSAAQTNSNNAFPEINPRQTDVAIAQDEAYWQRVAEQFEIKPGIINVENGNWGLMAMPVMQAYFAHTARVNRDNSYFSRNEYGSEIRPVIQQVAERLGVAGNEICLTRGATEALQNLIANYRLLKAGDSVIYSDLDYDAMQDAMHDKAVKSGANVVKLTIPEPASKDAILACYENALTQHKNARLLLLTHLSHRTGLVLPVAELTDMARGYNVDVIVDAAHSWGQIDFDVSDLNADFIGFNMHKWLGAPIGVGIMYIRNERLHDIAPNMSASAEQQDSIWGRVHTGTSNFAAFLTVPDALKFHDWVGAQAKQARLHYLRNLWVQEVTDDSRIDILTPEDALLHAGITSFRIKGRESAEDNRAIAKYLLAHHRVFTVHRSGIASGSCVRITPGFYNSAADLKVVAGAVKDAIEHFAV